MLRIALLSFAAPLIAAHSQTLGAQTVPVAAHTAPAANASTPASADRRESVNVRTYGATGNGVADDTAAILSAIGALPDSDGTLLFPPGRYLISDALTIAKPRTRISAHGANLVQTGSFQRGFFISAPGVVLEGMWLSNNRGGGEWRDRTPTTAIALDISRANSTKIRECRIENWGYAAIRVYHSSDVEIAGNEIVGVGAAGGLVPGANDNMGFLGYESGAASPGLRIVDNTFRDLAQGIFIAYEWSDVVISANVIRDIVGQHGMYLGTLRNAVISGNSISRVGHIGIKLQVASTTPPPPAGDSINVMITGNSVSDAGQAGIAIVAAQPNLAPYIRNVAVVANAIHNTGDMAIYVDHADGYSVAENVISDAGGIGIKVLAEARSGRIVGNYLTTTAGTGIYVDAQPGSQGILEHNVIDSPCLGRGASTDLRSVIYVRSGEWSVRENSFRNTNSCLSRISSHAGATLALDRNISSGGKDNGIGGELIDSWQTNFTPSQGSSVAPDIQTTHHLVVTVPRGVRAFTIAKPRNPDSDVQLTITIRNASGSAIATAWDDAFRIAPWMDPAPGRQRSIIFRRDRGGRYIETARTPADVPYP